MITAAVWLTELNEVKCWSAMPNTARACTKVGARGLNIAPRDGAFLQKKVPGVEHILSDIEICLSRRELKLCHLEVLHHAGLDP